jgi:hypothetical protein
MHIFLYTTFILPLTLDLSTLGGFQHLPTPPVPNDQFHGITSSSVEWSTIINFKAIFQLIYEITMHFKKQWISNFNSNICNNITQQTLFLLLV